MKNRISPLLGQAQAPAKDDHQNLKDKPRESDASASLQNIQLYSRDGRSLNKMEDSPQVISRSPQVRELDPSLGVPDEEKDSNPNLPSPTPNVPPTKNDWDLLFCPMLDEYFNPSPSVVQHVLVVVVQEPIVSTGTPYQEK
ncbi:hypothetical protein Tco_0408953 [Tanacetum coccineum]